MNTPPNHPRKGKTPPNVVRKVINYPTNVITHHMFGKHHTHRHKMSVGGGVMVIEVVIASSAHYFPFHVIQLSLDLIGYAIHGLGASPYIEYFVEKIKSEENEEK